jgi:hypothetical protein
LGDLRFKPVIADVESESEILVLRILERLRAEELVSKVVYVRGQSDEERPAERDAEASEPQDFRSLGSLPPGDLNESSPDNTRGIALGNSQVPDEGVVDLQLSRITGAREEAKSTSCATSEVGGSSTSGGITVSTA